MRVAIERPIEGGPPWHYKGTATLPDETFPLRVEVSDLGEVRVQFDEPALVPSDLTEKVRLLVRTAYRQAKADDEPPAWRIVRWRTRD